MLPTFIFLDIAIIAAFGTMWLPFMPNALFVQGLIQASVGGEISTLQYLACISLPSFLAVVVYLLIGKFLLRIDTSKYVEASKLNEGKQVTFSLNEKYALVAISLFVLGVGLPSFLPTTWLPIAILSRMGIVGVSILSTVGLIILNNRHTGKPIADFKEIAREGYGDFSAIVLTGAILLVGSAVTAEGTGISDALTIMVIPLINKVSTTIFIAIVAVVLALVSQVSMNMVLMMIFSPLLASILLEAGYNPMTAVMISYLATNVAFLAPSGSMPAALVFSNTSWVAKKNIYKLAVPWAILSVIVFIIYAIIVPNIVCANLVA